MGHDEESLNKITRPVAPGVLLRERLFTGIDAARSSPILWVSAPGGSGKTTLVSSYLESRSLPSLWYQVDHGDSDIATFLYFMRLAARKAIPRSRKPLPVFSRDHLAVIPAFSRRFFESLFACLPRPFGVILDNFQDATGPSFHDVVHEAMEAVPSGITVIIISRETPPAHFVRLQTNSRLKLLDWEQVRFTPDETAEFVRMQSHDRLTNEQSDCFYQKTEGWVAGLLLILEHLKHASIEPEAGIRTPDEIFRYFAAEVFNQQDEARQGFLLITSLLPYMPVSLTERLTGIDRAGRFLAELTRSHYFTSRRLGREAVYQYHQLFREFLQTQAEELLGRRQVAALCSSAAALLEEAGDAQAAVALFAKALNWQGAAETICRQAPAFLAQGRSETVREWLRLLPPDIVDGSAALLYWSGSALTNLDPKESRERFKRAFALFREQGDRAWMFLAWSAAAETTFFVAEYTVQQEWFNVLRSLLDEDLLFPSPEVETQVIMSTFNVMSFAMTDHPEIGCWYERAYDIVLNEKSMAINLRLMTGVKLRVYAIWQGDFARAAILHDFLVKLSHSDGVSDLVRQAIYSGSVLYCFVTGRCAEGIKLAEEAEAHRNTTGISVLIPQTLAHALSCALSVGDTAAIEALQDRLARHFNEMRHIDVVVYRLGLAWRLLGTGDFAQARQHAELVLALTRRIGYLSAEAITLSALAEVMSEQGESEEALRVLSRGYELAERVNSDLLRFFCLLVEARIAFGKNDDEAGLAALKRAFALGRMHGFANKFWWRPVVMADLCARSLEAGIETEYVRRLIRLRNLTEYPPSVEVEAWPWPVRVFTLGEFRLQVDDEPVRFSGKVQKKPLEMLKALVALGGGEAREGQIANLLWPDADGDTARSALKITLHRLRDLLGCDGAVQVREGRIGLDRGLVWIDIWAFDRLLRNAQLKGDAGDEEEAVRLTEKALVLYRGQFLDEEGDKPWVVSPRKKLKGRYVLHVLALGNLWRQRNDLKSAIACYLRGLEVDDLAEELYQNLMECYLVAGLNGEAVDIYQRCRTCLAFHGIKPSVKTVETYRSVLSS